MIALDTNVLVRYLVEDDAEQSARAARLIEGAADQGDAMFVAHIVVCEVVWVLQVAYRIGKPEVIATLKNLVRASPGVGGCRAGAQGVGRLRGRQGRLRRLLDSGAFGGARVRACGDV